jgi:hypothetical protein
MGLGLDRIVAGPPDFPGSSLPAASSTTALVGYFAPSIPKNYYAGKLEAFSPGLSVTHFAVIQGVEGPHIQRTLPIPAVAGTMFRVRLDASGPRFTISVQNQLVEDWEDDRIRAGGVGFLNEREERGQVESVRISFPKGGRL